MFVTTPAQLWSLPSAPADAGTTSATAAAISAILFKSVFSDCRGRVLEARVLAEPRAVSHLRLRRLRELLVVPWNPVLLDDDPAVVACLRELSEEPVEV